MKQKALALNEFVLRLVGSPKFFYAVLVLFLIQAAWIALFARYPQAFDENFHFGLIQLHAQQWLPYFDHQPAGASIYGSIVRDPSYLYHYGLSLIYRLLDVITDNQVAQIVVLRLVNVGLFAAGLCIFRKLFVELGIPLRTAHLSFLFLVLLPVVPVLAGQLNYDNAIVPLTALLFLYAVRIARLLRDQTTHLTIPVTLLLQLATVGIAGCLVKFSYLPVFFAVVAGLVWLSIWRYRRHLVTRRLNPQLAVERIHHEGPSTITHTFVSGNRFLVVVLVMLTVGLTGLAFERYGVNLISYHTPTPSCDTVLTIEECLDYAPWARNYSYAATYPRPQLPGYLVYPFVWINRMVWETMFVITSYFNPDGTVMYAAYSPLRIGYAAAWTVLGLAVIGLLRNFRQIYANRNLRMLTMIILFYTLVLFVQNFSDYHQTGEVVAVHGRYMVPFFAVLLVGLVAGLSMLLRRLSTNVYHVRGLFIIVVILVFMQGGGISYWIIRSDSSWYWQNAPVALHANQAAQFVLKKVIYTGK